MPLLLPEKESNSGNLEKPCPCLLCDEQTFKIPSEQNELLTHLLEVHRLVIADVNLISDMPAYIQYWKDKLKHTPLTNFCTVMRSHVKSKDKEEGKQENIFFLSDVLLEDRELRMHLQMKKLEEVLDFQETERNNRNFKRTCLFCRTIFEGKHVELLDHMASDHNFSVGQPNNLVFVDELLNLLEQKLDDKVCIFCEKVFKTREVLKEHMRKKGHKKINPKNKAYDKFYLVNYREFGKTWESLSKETDFEEDLLPHGFESDESGDDENDWKDWRGDQSGAICLFCSASYTEMNDLLNHMTSIHDFDFQDVRNSKRLNFYQQLKLINYLRRQVHLNLCIFCSDKLDSRDELLIHMDKKGHMKIPEDASEWDQPQFFFPTYENDNMLHFLDDFYDSESSVPVISEDLPKSVKESLLNEPEFLEQVCPSLKRQNM